LIQFYQLSVFWALINLVPVLPLDGGRIAEALTSSTNKAAKIGTVAGAIAAVALLVSGYLIGAAFFGYLSYQSYKRAIGQHTGVGPSGF